MVEGVDLSKAHIVDSPVHLLIVLTAGLAVSPAVRMVDPDHPYRIQDSLYPEYINV